MYNERKRNRQQIYNATHRKQIYNKQETNQQQIYNNRQVHNEPATRQIDNKSTARLHILRCAEASARFFHARGRKRRFVRQIEIGEVRREKLAPFGAPC
jgi:hypothetical protein